MRVPNDNRTNPDRVSANVDLLGVTLVEAFRNREVHEAVQGFGWFMVKGLSGGYFC